MNFSRTVSQSSVHDLCILFRATKNVIGALEAAGNAPIARSSDILSEWLSEADARLQIVAEEIKQRDPEDDSDRQNRFRCLAAYAAMLADSPSELQEIIG